jgi:YHS domain-containing protein
MTKDPICGMTVDVATALHAERDGQSFYFCSEHCRKEFLPRKAPTKAGGIGENCPSIRARICEGLEFLGVELDASRYATHEPLISRDAARVKVRVIRTDEELMIARSVTRMLG